MHRKYHYALKSMQDKAKSSKIKLCISCYIKYYKKNIVKLSKVFGIKNCLWNNDIIYIEECLKYITLIIEVIDILQNEKYFYYCHMF